MSYLIAPMRYPDQDDEVRAVFALCHPGQPQHPAHWYFAHPTLVALDADDRVLGFTAFMLALSVAEQAKVMSGQDVCVRPDAQGLGIGTALHRARRAMGQAMGATLCLGMTWEGNHAMIRILEASGMKPHGVVPGYYQYPPADGIVYLGPLA